jgi:hypothetical protein
MPVTNKSLNRAKERQRDEFYTLYGDIEREVNAYVEYNKDVFRDKTVLCPCDDPTWSNFTQFFVNNFEALGLQKLISTCIASGDDTQGKVLVLDRSNYLEGDKVAWQYLNGDGDFRSEETTKYRDEADIIVTNPPFSLFREFFKWVIEANKSFLVVANLNTVITASVFPYIKENKIWLGKGFDRNVGCFRTIYEYRDENGLRRFCNCCWLTNLPHNCRQPMKLNTLRDIKAHSIYKELRGKDFVKYDNYDAIDIPYVKSIPLDYDGAMGVPITFLYQYLPEQFEILDKLSSPRLMERALYKRIIIRNRPEFYDKKQESQ